ncbi:MAG TPA: LptF/LptG family permease [Saprospiraceae bacterium]|nr:LptF/LptG family permease [Saprospiraceae bacterium]HMP23435.1 LptF/LptG family permease [Saprospiraceae bacterium]
MLKTLDRYILRKFLTTFFFTVLIFTMIAVVIDFSEKVQKFLDEPITAREILLEYYPNFILFIASLLWPLFTLIAVIFFTSRMASNSEIISIFNAGVSYRRFMRPYMVGAVLIALMNLAGNHYVVPMGNKTMLKVVYTYIDKNANKGQTQNVHLFLSPETKVFIEFFRPRDTTARNFRIEHFENQRLTSLLKAESGRWIGAEEKWQLSNYEIHIFNEEQEELIVGRGRTIDTVLNLRPSDFVDYKDQHSMMITSELKSYIALQKQRGVGNTKRYEVELYRRTADAVTIFILTIIGMSIASRKVRGGIGLQLAIGIGLGAIFVFLARFSIVFATGQIVPPIVGIWMPNLIFSFIAIYLVANAQK